MKRFADYNPAAVFLYFIAVSLAAMLCMNPVVLIISLIGSLTFFFVSGQTAKPREQALFFVFFLLISLINPIFNHNGATVLFILNNNPVTLEAVLYGVAAGVMIISIIFWFRSFSAIMTSDKLLYVFGSLLPKTALILSMTLRYIPLFKRQMKKTVAAQKALGLAQDDNIIDRTKGGLRVFSAMVTWGLENGIITADSMCARGYGTGKRSRFALYRLRRSDVLLLAAVLAPAAAVFLGMASGAVEYDYYPYFSVSELSLSGTAAYAAYALLAFLPSVIEAEGRLKWKYLQSKI